MSKKGLAWRKVGKEWKLYRAYWPNGSERRYPESTGYMVESRYCSELREWLAVLTYPDRSTGQFHSITEAKAEAEKEARQ